jgi:hypothetical protein
MDNSQWGLCKDCKWWQIDPDGHPANNTHGTLHRGEASAVSVASIRQQRVQPIHARQARPRRRLKRRPADGRTDAIEIAQLFAGAAPTGIPFFLASCSNLSRASFQTFSLSGTAHAPLPLHRLMPAVPSQPPWPLQSLRP